MDTKTSIIQNEANNTPYSRVPPLWISPHKLNKFLIETEQCSCKNIVHLNINATSNIIWVFSGVVKDLSEEIECDKYVGTKRKSIYTTLNIT